MNKLTWLFCFVGLAAFSQPNAGPYYKPQTAVGTNTVSAVMYGFKFDGSDETALLQQVANLATNGVGLLFVQDGPRAITHQHVYWHANTTVNSWGKYFTAFKAVSNCNDLIFTTDLDGNSIINSNITFANFTLDLQAANQLLHPWLTNTSPWWRQVTNINGTLYQTNVQTGPSLTGIQNEGLWINSVSGCRVQNVRVLNAPGFAVTVGGNVKHVYFDNVTVQFDNQNQLNSDGFHFWWPIEDVVLNDCEDFGGHDDCLAWNSNEWIASAMGWTNGSYVPGRGTNCAPANYIRVKNFRAYPACAGTRWLAMSDDGNNWVTNFESTGYSAMLSPSSTGWATVEADGNSTTAPFVPFRVKGWHYYNTVSEGAGSVGFQVRNILGTDIEIRGFTTHSAGFSVDDGNCYFDFMRDIDNVLLSGLDISCPDGSNNPHVIVNNHDLLTNCVITSSFFTGTNITYIYRNSSGTAGRGKTVTMSGISAYPPNLRSITNLPGGTVAAVGDALLLSTNYCPDAMIPTSGAQLVLSNNHAFWRTQTTTNVAY